MATAITKPDFTTIWASGGSKVSPDTSKISSGWGQEMLPFQYENWIQNRQDQGIAYLLQSGVVEWDSSTQYFSGKSFVQRGGNLYRCVQDSIGNDPTVLGVYWEKIETLNGIATSAPLSSETSWDDVPSISTQSGLADDTLNAQPQALANRTEYLKDVLENSTDVVKGPGALTLNQSLDYPSGTVGAALVAQSLPELRVSQLLSVSQLRASIDTELDITSQLTALITLSKSSGFRGILIDVPRAKITATLPQLNSSFDFVKLRGLGQGKTKLNVSEAGQTPFVWQGGSGGHAGTVIEGMSILGSDTQDIFLNKGFCGADVVDCTINGRVIGVLSNDIGEGTFTEFFRLVRCNVFCDAVFTMKRGAGNDSFHGCGWPRSIINQRESGTFLVKLGDSADTGRCIWYHGEIDSILFPRQSSGPLIVNGNSTYAATSIVSTSGVLKIEYLGSGAPTVSSIPSHIHSGGYLELTAGAIPAGTMRLVSSGGFSTSTVPAYTVTEGRALKQTAVSTSFTLPFVDYGCGRLGFLWVQGDNYEYLQLICFAGRISPAISPSVYVISTLREFNAAGWGAPVLTMGDTDLTVSGSAWSGTMTVRFTELPGVLRPY